MVLVGAAADGHVVWCNVAVASVARASNTLESWEDVASVFKPVS
jgi:hypothetical protein